MRIMEMLRILQIHLENVTLRWICRDGRNIKIIYVVDPAKISNGRHIAQPYRLLTPKYIRYIDGFDESYDCMWPAHICLNIDSNVTYTMFDE